MGYVGSPFVRAHIPSVPREEPVMAFQVFDSILPFAINGFVEILHNLGARRFRPVEVSINIVDEDGQALSSVAELRRALGACWCAPARTSAVI